MLSCEHHQRALRALARDADVTLTDATALHIEACTACHTVWEETFPPWEAADSAPLTDAARAALLTRARRPIRWGRFAVAGATALAVAATLLLAVRPAPAPPEEPTPVAAPAASPPNDAVPVGTLDMIAEARALLGDLEIEEARALLDEIEAGPIDPDDLGAVDRLSREMAGLGVDAPSLEGVEWLLDHAAYDDVTLMFFFEEWCPHCRRASPDIIALHERWADRGLGVIGVTRGSRTGVEAAQDYIEEQGLTFPVALDADGAISGAFAVRGIPAAALVVDGAVAWRGHPMRLPDLDLATILD